MKQLSFLDKTLSLWILLAIVFGTLLGVYVPSVRSVLNTSEVEHVSIPVFVGLLLMLYPVFCKVKYEDWFRSRDLKNWKFVILSIVLNWIICPFVMAALAWATLPDLPDYRTGVLLIGIARCIAMVLVWNDLANGHLEWCTLLVALNSVLQMILYAPLSYLFCVVLGSSSSLSIDMWMVTKNVLYFLGIPFLGGLLTRLALRAGLGAERYDHVFVPWISPLALMGLIYTIIILFALQGYQMVHQWTNALRVMVPLLLYFSSVWIGTMVCCKYLRFPFDMGITQSFTAASNNFELAMAMSIATWGVDSHEALATTMGPLVEVPVLLALVYLTPHLKNWYDSE